MLTAGLQLLEHVPIVRLDATPAGFPIYLTRGLEEEYRLVRMERGRVLIYLLPCRPHRCGE